MPTIKFFPSDRLSGKMSKVGDKFTAKFMGMKCQFVVVEAHDGFVMAELV